MCHNYYELDLNGLNYDGARKSTCDPRPHTRALDAAMPVRLAICFRVSTPQGKDIGTRNVFPVMPSTSKAATPNRSGRRSSCAASRTATRSLESGVTCTETDESRRPPTSVGRDCADGLLAPSGLGLLGG